MKWLQIVLIAVGKHHDALSPAIQVMH